MKLGERVARLEAEMIGLKRLMYIILFAVLGTSGIEQFI